MHATQPNKPLQPVSLHLTIFVEILVVPIMPGEETHRNWGNKRAIEVIQNLAIEILMLV